MLSIPFRTLICAFPIQRRLAMENLALGAEPPPGMIPCLVQGRMGFLAGTGGVEATALVGSIGAATGLAEAEETEGTLDEEIDTVAATAVGSILTGRL